MKKIFKIFFLKLKKYFFNFQEEIFLIVVIFFLGVFLIFLSNFSENKNFISKPHYGGVYREGIYEEIEPLNPVSPKNDSQRAILNIIYPPLIEFDNGKLISKFLKNYSPSSDYLSYTLELKDNLKWSNGDPITSDDVFFSFNLLKKEGSPEVVNLFKDSEIQIIDSQKFVFNLKSNNNYFLYNLRHLRIFPQKIFSSISLTNFSLENLKIGSGPFIFEAYVKNKKIPYLLLKRNEFYNPQPYLEKIIFYLYPSPRKAFDGLLLKEIDGLAGLNYFNLPSNIFYHYSIHKIVLPRVIGIFFNSKKVDQNYVDFLERKVNRDFLVENIFKGYAEKTHGIFSKTLRKVLTLPDLDNDQKEVKESKLTKIVLTTLSSYFYPEIARYFRDNFNFEIEFLSPEVFNQKVENKDYQAILTGINFFHPPALFYFFSVGGLNLNNVENLSLEKAFQQIILDPKIKLEEKLAEIEKKIIALKSNIFLVNPFHLFILSKKIKGYNQFYLFDSSARFVKIEYWFKDED